MLHDLKMLMRRLANEESFSRDSLGGGPEHNMHLIPFMIQMITHLLKRNEHYRLHEDKSDYTYI